MLYLDFHEQVYMASWAVCAFPLQPLPAKSQLSYLSHCGADSDSPNRLGAHLG